MTRRERKPGSASCQLTNSIESLLDRESAEAQLRLLIRRSTELQLKLEEKTAGDEIEAKKPKYKRNLSQRVPSVSTPIIIIAPMIDTIAMLPILRSNFFVLSITHLSDKSDSITQAF
jgi:hypothetical protein